MTDSAFAFGLGVGSLNSAGEWLEVFYPDPILSPTDALATAEWVCTNHPNIGSIYGLEQSESTHYLGLEPPAQKGRLK